MHTIIIGDGLANENLGLEHSFQARRSHVGRQEVERLMGPGKAYGKGPLPEFIRRALRTKKQGGPVSLVLLGRRLEASDGSNEPRLSRSLRFVDPIAKISQEASVVPSSKDSLPWTELLEVFGKVAGYQADSFPSGIEDTQFLVLGCQTEYRILEIASFLRNILGCQSVAVSSHLVGSATREAHFAALQHHFPGAGIQVFLDLEKAAAYAGINESDFTGYQRRPCAIEPMEARDKLRREQERIIQLLCMHWTKAFLRPLAGGFSGSALFLADGWKGEARTEPMVVKVDDFAQMRRDLQGYRQVTDFFGKHVPTFGYPVTDGDYTGVAMELAAMEGHPGTLQDTFETAEGEKNLQVFLLRLKKALSLLCEKLYGNTRDRSWVVPYREFGLHAEVQVTYLLQNVEFIETYLESEAPECPRPDSGQLAKLLRLIAANADGLDSEVCVSHGDLNFANIICDEGDNIWFIDWTHSDEHPVELDFAKLENDVKFVISKDFDYTDLDRLRQFEEYLLSRAVPPDSSSLPESLKFAKWDLRFRKMLDAVRMIRKACFALKEEEDWLVYRIALLRYALHTLSFDKRRDRGECDECQLITAYYSVESLVHNLVVDDFHLRIRAEKPASYPARQRISIDQSPWLLECEEYDPPYHVDASVLENDRSANPDAWADPEEFALVEPALDIIEARFHDDLGRALNPRGRTGIAGRGLLGRWGPNHSVAAIVLRRYGDSDQIDILLGGQEGTRELDLPKGFILPEESFSDAMARVLEGETGWDPDVPGSLVFEGFTYDHRQTDHAWVESHAFLFQTQAEEIWGTFEPRGLFDEIRWWPLVAETVNRIPSDQARFVRETIDRLMETGDMEAATAESLLSST